MNSGVAMVYFFLLENVTFFSKLMTIMVTIKCSNSTLNLKFFKFLEFEFFLRS